jgi:hypothetical protein
MCRLLLPKSCSGYASVVDFKVKGFVCELTQSMTNSRYPRAKNFLLF